MNRQYQESTEEEIEFFIGTEVEHSPAHGMKTLFVVGLQPVEEIIKKLKDPFTSIGGPVEHIYFGANMSFPVLQTNDFNGWGPWEVMIDQFLEQGYWCTLDIPAVCVEGLLESGLCEYNNFIPMISVKLPYIQQLGYNATIKLDDKDFDASNPGVWCHQVHELMNRRNFTNWNQYKKDSVLK